MGQSKRAVKALIRAAAGVLAASALLSAQEPAGPRFEVVSIRVVPPNTPPTLRDMDFTPVLPGGQFVDSRVGLWSMIAFAYDIKDAWLTLVGLPKWAVEESYAVAAKPAAGFPLLPAAENRQQVRLMMRALLEERFQLRLHTEMREGQILRMEVAKGGIRLKEVDAPVPPAKERPVGLALDDRSGRLIGEHSTMAGIVAAIAVQMKHPVVDATGLKGYYTFDVKWNSPDAADAGSRSGLGAAGVGLLISTLRDQCGLQLRAIKGPVKYWVVDHVERPAGN